VSDWPWDLTFEVAFDVNPADEPVTADWTDLSDRLRKRPGVRVERGQPGGQARGTATLDLNNRDRELDPTHTSATHNLVPMRHARVNVTVGETTFPLFRGFVKAWPPVWPEADQGIVSVHLVDAFAWIGLQQSDVDLTRQRTHDRVGAILDLAGWPAAHRDIADGVVWLDPVERSDANLLQMLIDTADAEDGELYVDGEGAVTFRSRHGRFDTAEQETFGPDGIRVAAVRPLFDVDQLTNIAVVELDEDTTWTFEDAGSVTAYGPRSWPVRGLPLRKAEAVGAAQWVVYRFAQPHLWLPGLTAYGHRDGQLPQLLGLEVGDRVGFEHTPPGPGNAEMSGHIESIVHTVGDGTWTTAVEVSPYFGEGPWAQWETAEAVSGTTWATAEATEGPRWAP